MSFEQYWEKIIEKNDEYNSLITEYWNQFSHFGTWQFWYVLSILILPLVILYFTVDRKRIFEVFFFGYTVHMAWTYIDLFLSSRNYLSHNYFVSPLFPMSFGITASALPVAFLLLYQFCTNRNKNFYLYTLVLSAIFSLVLLPIKDYYGIVEFYKGFNAFYVLLIDLVIVYSAYWFTKLVFKMRKIG